MYSAIHFGGMGRLKLSNGERNRVCSSVLHGVNLFANTGQNPLRSTALKGEEGLYLPTGQAKAARFHQEAHKTSTDQVVTL